MTAQRFVSVWVSERIEMNARHVGSLIKDFLRNGRKLNLTVFDILYNQVIFTTLCTFYSKHSLRNNVVEFSEKLPLFIISVVSFSRHVSNIATTKV
jgi:hypothetical protein